jgi:hypothetical protein
MNCVLSTLLLAILLLLLTVSADADAGELGTGSSATKATKKQKAVSLFDPAGSGKKEKGRRGKKGRQRKRRSKASGKGSSMHSYDGCPCFDRNDIDDHWNMYKSKYNMYMGDDPCDHVEYEEDDGDSWFLMFEGNEYTGGGFEFYVEDDDDIGVCEVSKFYDPPMGDADVERSFTGMDFENMAMVGHCIDEIMHSYMYQECIE